ncbi:hypothetical protein WN944_026600 [Citrus x changshan-huyou]|uniref:Uncharacterized protein n=1 Tax=Citrus x changshan-huyou TaxID=2935761 RepID=A0AAP0LUQ5_9ROSI
MPFKGANIKTTRSCNIFSTQDHAISSQPKTTWPPPSHVTPPPSSLGRARPSRSTGGARRKLWTGVPAAAQISSLTTVVRHVVDPRESQS